MPWVSQCRAAASKARRQLVLQIPDWARTSAPIFSLRDPPRSFGALDTEIAPNGAEPDDGSALKAVIRTTAIKPPASTHWGRTDVPLQAGRRQAAFPPGSAVRPGRPERRVCAALPPLG
jgi:hypothetical protein